MEIHCEKCGHEFTPSAEQLAFIERSAQKGMTFIMLECTQCGRSSPWNPRDKKRHSPPEPKRLRLGKQIKLQQLAKDYQAFVRCFDGANRHELKHCSWKLYTAADLEELVNISGMLVPRSRSLAAYARTLREHCGGRGTTDERDAHFDYNRLKAGFCIGNENGDELFIDQDSGAVYCWHHDGGDVERLADSFAVFLANAYESTDAI